MNNNQSQRTNHIISQNKGLPQDSQFASIYQPCNQSLSISNEVLTQVFSKLNNKINQIEATKKLKPYLANSILQQNIRVIQLFKISYERKFDDCYINDQESGDDKEPSTCQIDGYMSNNKLLANKINSLLDSQEFNQSHNLIKEKGSQIIKTSKVLNYLSPNKQSRNSIRGDSPNLQASKKSVTQSTMKQELIQQFNSNEQQQNKQQKLVHEDKSQAIDEKETSLINQMRDSMLKRKEKIQRNLAMNAKNLKINPKQKNSNKQNLYQTLTDFNTSFFNNGTDDSFQNNDLSKIDETKYTFDQNGGILQFKKLNAGVLKLAKLEMQPNNNYQIQNGLEVKKSSRKSEKSFSISISNMKSFKASPRGKLMNQHFNEKQENQLEQQELSNLQEKIHPSNGVSLKTEQGILLRQGLDFFMKDFNGQQRINKSMYKTFYSNNQQNNYQAKMFNSINYKDNNSISLQKNSVDYGSQIISSKHENDSITIDESMIKLNKDQKNSLQARFEQIKQKQNPSKHRRIISYDQMKSNIDQQSNQINNSGNNNTTLVADLLDLKSFQQSNQNLRVTDNFNTTNLQSFGTLQLSQQVTRNIKDQHNPIYTQQNTTKTINSMNSSFYLPSTFKNSENIRSNIVSRYQNGKYRNSRQLNGSKDASDFVMVYDSRNQDMSGSNDINKSSLNNKFNMSLLGQLKDVKDVQQISQFQKLYDSSKSNNPNTAQQHLRMSLKSQSIGKRQNIIGSKTIKLRNHHQNQTMLDQTI
eukprot:403352659